MEAAQHFQMVDNNKNSKKRKIDFSVQFENGLEK
jgi:hypothetical protein